MTEPAIERPDVTGQPFLAAFAVGVCIADRGRVCIADRSPASLAS